MMGSKGSATISALSAFQRMVMMMRIIDAHLVQEIADREIGGETASLIQYVLSHTPTIEAEPVRHGRWIKTDNGIRININTGEPFRAYLHDCSACGWHTGNQGSRFNYCPNCGAKMDGDKHDTEE